MQLQVHIGKVARKWKWFDFVVETEKPKAMYTCMIH